MTFGKIGRKMERDIRRMLEDYKDIESPYDLTTIDLDYLITKYPYMDNLTDTIRNIINERK